ncbi:MAG: L,D-transpeptidase [Clostridiales bacterium]|nr:L,D-transpeptidase [Clostridiales bacterium]
MKKTRKKSLRRVLLACLAVFVVLELVAYYFAWPRRAADEIKGEKKKEEELDRRLAAQNSSLERRVKTLAPRGIYIVVDSGNNILSLRRGPEILRRVVVSCGSGSILEEPGGRRRWVFDTPRGGFYIKSKVKNPDWIKPDWAFIEEGEKIPKDPRERVESGVLGEYALGFGDGYFIHGTLYTRLLGRSVTHGCIRVGDEDLKVIFEKVSIGTKVFIY